MQGDLPKVPHRTRSAGSPQPPPLDPRGMPPIRSILFPVISLPYLLFLHLPPPLLGRDRLPRFHGNPPLLPSLLQRGFHPFLSKVAIFSSGFPFSPSPLFTFRSRFPRQTAPTGAATATEHPRELQHHPHGWKLGRGKSGFSHCLGPSPDPDVSLNLCLMPPGVWKWGIKESLCSAERSWEHPELAPLCGLVLRNDRPCSIPCDSTTGIWRNSGAGGTVPFLQLQRG